MSLNDDIIWLIAKINASDDAFDKQHRLTTTRLTSQVCRHWREVILGSPLIWGRLILLDKRQSTAWIEEVFRRAGESSRLWIHFSTKSTLSHDYDRLISFLLVIFQHWNRIEALKISTSIYVHQSLSEPSKLIWEFMSIPAPVLRSFVIENTGSSNRFPNDISGNIFAGDAPKLRNFSCVGTRIPTKATWLSHLDTLYFTPKSLDDISNIRKWIPYLQTLGIVAGADCFHRRESVDYIQLTSMSSYIIPRLEYIDAGMSFSAFNALWSTSSTPLGTNFSAELVLLYNYSTIEGLDNKKQLPETLSNFFHNYTVNIADTFRTNRWSLSIHPFHMQIQALSVSTTHNTKIDLKFHTADSPTMKPFLLKCLSPYMRTATDFILDITISKKKLSLTDLGDVMLMMTRVTSITLIGRSMEWYNRIDRSRELIFPELKIIKCDGNVYGSEGYMQELVLFLQRREQFGRVLPVIHSIKTSGAFICDSLNRIPGSRIRWTLSKDWVYDRELKLEYVDVIVPGNTVIA